MYVILRVRELNCSRNSFLFAFFWGPSTFLRVGYFICFSIVERRWELGGLGMSLTTSIYRLVS